VDPEVAKLQKPHERGWTHQTQLIQKYLAMRAQGPASRTHA